jgi:hypothetical protein
MGITGLNCRAGMNKESSMTFGIFGGGNKDKDSKSQDRRREERHRREAERDFIKDSFDSQKRQSDERAKKGGW